MTARRVRLLVLALILALLGSAGAGCAYGGQDEARKKLQAEKAVGETLEKANLAKKKNREENANAIGYVYLYSFGQPMGYYVAKGKISSSGSQRTPEDDIVWACEGGGCTHVVVDGPQDDGSYGGHDPGIFFFLADDTMVVTSFDYLYTDRPIQGVNVPLLGGQPVS
jgi:hypothetical protein